MNVPGATITPYIFYCTRSNNIYSGIISPDSVTTIEIPHPIRAIFVFQKTIMFHSISWQRFIAFFSVALAFYYSAIGILFFRKDMPRLIARVRRLLNGTSRETIPGKEISNQENP